MKDKTKKLIEGLTITCKTNKCYWRGKIKDYSKHLVDKWETHIVGFQWEQDPMVCSGCPVGTHWKADQPCVSAPDELEGWEERFDEYWFKSKDRTTGTNMHRYEVKAFLANLLKAQKKETKEEFKKKLVNSGFDLQTVVAILNKL